MNILFKEPEVQPVGPGRKLYGPPGLTVPDVVDAFVRHAVIPGDQVRALPGSLLDRSWRSGPGSGARNTVRAAIKFQPILPDSLAVSAVTERGDD